MSVGVAAGHEGNIMETDHRKKVLIVDNNERILLIIQRVLENVGFDTEITWSGGEALALMESQVFDVLLVDDYLPDRYHSDFLKQVGALPVQPWIVVMQASAPTASDLREYASLGVFSVVRKHHIAEVCKAVSRTADQPLAMARVN